MKIAFLNIYNGVVERGSEVFVDELAGQLSRRHDVFVFQTGIVYGKTYKPIRIKGISNIREQGILYDFFVFLFTLKCIFFLWNGKFDWIIPVNGRLQTILIRIFRLLRGGKILISGHAGEGFDDKFNLVFGKPDVFVALSPVAYKWARKIASSRVEYIPNGIDIAHFNPRAKPAFLSLRPPIIMCVSALLPYKRIQLLINAVESVPHASLMVIGDGPLLEKIVHAGSHKLGNRFQLMRYIEHAQLSAYYKAASVFSLPSRKSEAFGLVYLEAMACNIPVVAPNDENRRSIIGGGGLFCDVENRDAYSDALKKAIKLHFGDKPRKQAEEFSWEKIAKQYEDVME